MLEINRRVNQAIVIGGKITITVYGITRGQVRLGVEAPREVSVDRAEIHELKTKGTKNHA